MLDMGMMEIMLIGVVALIVVGPKDLPRMLRTLGQYTAKLRGMAREFQRSMDDAAREADLAEFKDIKGALDDVRSVQSDAKKGIAKVLTDTERKIDREVDLEDTAETSAHKPTQPLPTPVSPVPEPPSPPAEPAQAQGDGTPPKTGTDA